MSEIDALFITGLLFCCERSETFCFCLEVGRKTAGPDAAPQGKRLLGVQ